MEFNADGTIRQVKVTLDGVGALAKVKKEKELKVKKVTASSVRPELNIRYQNDRRCQRTEYFDPEFAVDHSNGSRWMAQDEDAEPWFMIDLGGTKQIGRSEIAFVRPTQGHAYVLEGSVDGIQWERCGGHADVQKRSPHVDVIGKKYRYLRVKITEGIKGIWEWKLIK